MDYNIMQIQTFSHFVSETSVTTDTGTDVPV